MNAKIITLVKIKNTKLVISDVPILKYWYWWYWPIFVVSASSIGISKYSQYLPILFKHKINIKFFLYKYKNFFSPLELDWISNIINDFFYRFVIIL